MTTSTRPPPFTAAEAAADQPAKRPRRLALWLAQAILFSLAFSFVLAAGTRRLNFDEALALRSGWLLVHDVPAAPPFAMPATLLLGALATAVEDPGTVFLLARLATAAAVLLALAWALRRAARVPVALLAGLIILTQATFVAHALEFRYDGAILLGWLMAFGWLVRRSPRGYFGLGVCSAWLATHHLKGLYFGLALAAMTAAAIYLDRRRQPLRATVAAKPYLVKRYLLGAAAGLAAWLGLAALLGHLDDFLAVYATFFDLASGSAERVWPWTALGGTLRADGGWWVLVLLALLLTLLRLRRAEPGGRPPGETTVWALAFALVPLGFLFLHPHPWAYMLALPAPFLALFVAEALAGLRRARPLYIAAAAAAVLVAQLTLAGTWPWQKYLESLSAPRAPQVESLRVLRSRARADDRIVDPSGLAYFVPPCIEEWYLDTLFQEYARRGLWMSSMESVDLRRCAWMLNTYRLRMLPEAAGPRLVGTYVLLPGGLALHREDARLAEPGDWPTLAHAELLSFW